MGMADNATDGAEESAFTPLYAVTSPELEGVTDAYFYNSKVQKYEWADDRELQKRLWNISESY